MCAKSSQSQERISRIRISIVSVSENFSEAVKLLSFITQESRFSKAMLSLSVHSNQGAHNLQFALRNPFEISRRRGLRR